MITRKKTKYNLHTEMLKQSFQREGDGMTSILLGNATITAFNFFEKHIGQLQQHIKSLEAQLTNTEQLTCTTCLIYGECNIRKVLINPSLNAMNVCLTEEAKLFGCNYYASKDTQ